MSEFRNCFLPGDARQCTKLCMAFIEDGKTSCRILNVLERIAPIPSRPVAPTPPPTIKRT